MSETVISNIRCSITEYWYKGFPAYMVHADIGDNKFEYARFFEFDKDHSDKLKNAFIDDAKISLKQRFMQLKE